LRFVFIGAPYTDKRLFYTYRPEVQAWGHLGRDYSDLRRAI